MGDGGEYMEVAGIGDEDKAPSHHSDDDDDDDVMLDGAGAGDGIDPAMFSSQVPLDAFDDVFTSDDDTNASNDGNDGNGGNDDNGGNDGSDSPGSKAAVKDPSPSPSISVLDHQYESVDEQMAESNIVDADDSDGDDETRALL
eukprot:m.445125 g.445125  ORF g.445125 m.445125 type:complete len:143 (-) comp20300_c18_seq13:1736-2164(-)